MNDSCSFCETLNHLRFHAFIVSMIFLRGSAAKLNPAINSLFIVFESVRLVHIYLHFLKIPQVQFKGPR